MTLIAPSELAAIQAFGIEGMVTDVGIMPSIYDTGVDLTDDSYGSSLTWGPVSEVVKGWLVGRWAQSRDSDIGDIDSTTTYRLRLPVGTTLEPGWKVEIGGNTYTVIDVGSDQTWPEWLNCVVRRMK